MCPVPCHGSLVISTSPGRMCSAPIPLRKWRTVAGSVPMKDGMLPEFCASAKPRASVSTQAKSLASFDSVENEVRTMAFAASSTTEMIRVHSTSSVIASNPAGIMSAPSPCPLPLRGRGYPASPSPLRGEGRVRGLVVRGLVGRGARVITMLPLGATRAVAPGPTTSVEPSSSTTAGPASSSPTPRR